MHAAAVLFACWLASLLHLRDVFLFDVKSMLQLAGGARFGAPASAVIAFIIVRVVVCCGWFC